MLFSLLFWSFFLQHITNLNITHFRRAPPDWYAMVWRTREVCKLFWPAALPRQVINFSSALLPLYLFASWSLCAKGWTLTVSLKSLRSNRPLTVTGVSRSYVNLNTNNFKPIIIQLLQNRLKVGEAQRRSFHWLYPHFGNTDPCCGKTTSDNCCY